MKAKKNTMVDGAKVAYTHGQYGKRLRELICAKQCPFFALLKPRKDGHIWKTFTELDLETIIWK